MPFSFSVPLSGLWSGILLSPAFSDEKQQVTLNVSWEPWRPFLFKTDDDSLSGLDIEVLEAVAEDGGYKLVYHYIPWKRAVSYIKSGKIDVATSASITVERSQFAWFSDAYRHESAVIFVRKGEADNYPIHSLSDIVELKFNLGATRGFYYGGAFERLMKYPDFKKNIDIVTAESENYKKLLKKRIDGFLADPYSGSEGLRQQRLLYQVEIHPYTVYQDKCHFMFSKKTVPFSLVAKFNKSLQKLKDNGVVENILNNYLN